MKATTKATGVGLLVGLGAIALLAPTLASGSARTTVGSGAPAALVALPFIAHLSPANEVPPAADPDAEGAAAVTIDRVTGEVCIDLRATNIAPATAAHIHRGVAGVNGPVVVPGGGASFAALPSPTSANCVIVAAALALEIATTPAGFYVNVHNAEFPGGVIRGQLAPGGTTTGGTQLLNEPLRAYDSRVAPATILPNNTTRVVSLANGLDGANVNRVAVPPGATGALVRVTVTDTVGSGFLKVYSNALAGAPASSNVNWHETGVINGADTTVAVDSLSRIKITSGGGGSTHVVVDVVGYVF